MDYTSQQFLGVFFIHSYLHSPWIFHIFSVFKLLGWWRGFLIHWEKNQKSNSIGYQDISPLCCVAQSCLTLCDAVNCGPPSSFVHGIILARTLEWVAISYSRGSSWLRDQTHVSYVSCIGRWVLYHYGHLGNQIVHRMYYVHSELDNWAFMAYWTHHYPDSFCDLRYVICDWTLHWQKMLHSTCALCLVMTGSLWPRGL